MRNFNKLANLHNMFFKRSDDLSSKAVRSSNPPPAPRPNPKPVPEPTDGWNTPGMNKGNTKKVLEGRGYTEEEYNADTPFARKVRETVNMYGVHPDHFKSEDPTKNNMAKWIPRLGAGGQINSPLIPRGVQPVPADVGSQVAGGTGGAVAGGTGGVLGGPTNSVSNGPTAGSGGGSPSGSGPVSDYDKYRQGNPGTPTISDYEKYRQGNPGR